jgi:hypothetical protein
MDIVWIDSRRRASGTPEDFCVQLVNCLRGTDVSAVRVDKVRLTNSFRTVEHSNRYLYIRMGDGVVRAVALELGFYSAPEWRNTFHCAPGSIASTSVGATA